MHIVASFAVAWFAVKGRDSGQVAPQEGDDGQLDSEMPLERTPFRSFRFTRAVAVRIP